jgi:RNA polymerase sigma-70 factor (ECF subfamily)
MAADDTGPYLFFFSCVSISRGNRVSDSADQEQAQLRRARALDAGALAAIYEDYHPSMYRYIYRQVGDVEAARDLASDVFHRFLKAIHRGGGPDRHVSAWLYRTAHNAVVDYFRRQQHRQHLPLNENLVNGDDNPVMTVDRALAAAEIREALQRLSPDQRRVIALKFLEGMSNQDVALVMGKSVGAVKSLQHRALATLQRQLTPVDKERVL